MERTKASGLSRGRGSAAASPPAGVIHLLMRLLRTHDAILRAVAYTPSRCRGEVREALSTSSAMSG
ncbi:hypothetical protein BFL35_06140 [Clavibacter michiganensis]|nr:hypothetical protein BFL35_06140 [Clavibacter michiganensis]